MRILYYDCFAGISGDMNLGAMIDLGVDADYLRNELAKLNIKGFQLKTEKAERRGISGVLATVEVKKTWHEKHRHLKDVEDIVNSSALSDKVKALSLKIFRIIAEAEGKVHIIDIQKVHFHEVGALDSIADIVGAAICLDYLKVDKVISSPIQLGGGTVRCDHGIMPVPAPATALIVENLPVKTGLVLHEATTPTGAAILAATVDSYTSDLPAPIVKTAYGIGQRDVSQVPNVLRLYLLEDKSADADLLKETNLLLECNIDDMNPERYDFLFEQLFRQGACDVWLTPIIMKKLRPANTLSVLCPIEKGDNIKSILFQHSTTLGIRESMVTKNMLRREEKIIETPYGTVRVKVAYYQGKIVRSKAEYDDLKALALKNKLSITDIENAVSQILNHGH